MDIYYDGLIVGAFAVACIGVFHPIVIKAEFYFSKKIWPVFLVIGIVSVSASLFLPNVVLRCCVTVFGMTCLWSIHELFKQEKRVQKGWFPDGRKRPDKHQKGN